MQFILATLWLIAIAFLCQHILHNLIHFFDSRYANQYAIGCALVVLVIVALRTWTRWIISVQDTNKIGRAVLGFFLLILLSKILWCWMIDSAQPGDIGRYWKYGQLIASGESHRIALDAGDRLLGIYARRAFFYPAPCLWLFGSSLIVLEMSNILIQMSTFTLFYSWGKAVVGVRAAACSLPFLAIYPDSWYAPTLASHDTVAIFLLTLILWFGSKIVLKLCRTGEGSNHNILRSGAIYSAGLGAATAFLQQQRDFGIFVYAAIILATGYLALAVMDCRSACGFRSQGWRVASIGAFTFTVMLVSYKATIRVTDLALSEMRQRINADSGPQMVHYIGAISSKSEGAFSAMMPWMYDYSDSVPQAEKAELFYRKLLWEKFGIGADALFHIFRKNKTYSSCSRNMEYSLCGREGDWHELWDVPFHNFHNVVCSGLYAWLSFLTLARLILINQAPITWLESPVWFLSLAFALPLLLITESQGTYDQFLSVPIATSAGVFLSRRHLSAHRYEVPAELTAILGRSFLGIAGLILVVGVHFVIGKALNNAGLTFAEISNANGKGVEVQKDATGLIVSLDTPIESKGISPVIADARFEVNGRSLQGGKLRLFITADQANQRIFGPIDWNGCRFQFRLYIDGSIVRTGSIKNLVKPIFLNLPLRTQGMTSVKCRLVVTGDAEDRCRPSIGTYQERPIAPCLAIEYCY